MEALFDEHLRSICIDNLIKMGALKLFLQEGLYNDVATSAMRFKGQPGFGVRLIKIAASVIFAKHYSYLLDNACWIPSDSWCY